jgi:hypothetical protein
MKTRLLFAIAIVAFTFQLQAQKNCAVFSYQQAQSLKDPALTDRLAAIEMFTRNYSSSNQGAASRTEGEIIKIPVVVHILYHDPADNISDAKVISQLQALNKAFRRMNADTVNTPARFKGLAADCEIEFQLAVSDPKRRNTSGIIRKYTPITVWQSDDKMKFSSEMGSDAWDAKSYLNIWVCNLDRVAGYSSVPGSDLAKDGIVLGFNVFGTEGGMSGFNMGKTAVHEVGHWLNLKHIWGDGDCGDDGVNDTPQQAWYNVGCPSGNTVTCGNGPDGDMYMNYMDFTDDACMNLFTKGQKTRMQAAFAPGGIRNSLLSSTGLSAPLIFESPLPEEDPKWLHPQFYPNPASSQLTVDLSYDIRWIGKTMTLMNMQGQVIMQVPITAKVQTINTSNLKPGMYLLVSKKDDGETIKQKFVKL